MTYEELLERSVSFFKMLREEQGLCSDIARCYLRLELNYDIEDIDFIESEYERKN